MSFSINESLFIPNSQTQFKIEIGLNLSFSIDKDLLILLCRIFYHYPDTNAEEKMVDISVQNVFGVEDLKQFMVDGNELKLPPILISSIVSVSISHTRALMAQRISGTVYQDNIINVADGEKLARHFFPKMFEPEKSTKNEPEKIKSKSGKNSPSKHSY